MSALAMPLEETLTLCEPLGRTWSTGSFQCQCWSCHWKKLRPCASHWEELGACVLSNVSTRHANGRNWDLVRAIGKNLEHKFFPMSAQGAIGRNWDLVRAIGKNLEHEFFPMSALNMPLEETGTLCEPLGRTWSTSSFESQHWAHH